MFRRVQFIDRDQTVSVVATRVSKKQGSKQNKTVYQFMSRFLRFLYVKGDTVTLNYRLCDNTFVVVLEILVLHFSQILFPYMLRTLNSGFKVDMYSYVSIFRPLLWYSCGGAVLHFMFVWIICSEYIWHQFCFLLTMTSMTARFNHVL